MVESGDVRVRVPRGRWRTGTTSARKGLWPWSRMCSLKQPTLIANLQSHFQNSLFGNNYTERHTHFPDLSIERRHVVVALDSQLKHCRRTRLEGFTLVSSV